VAADEVYLGLSKNKRWWVRTFGLYNDRLFVTFRNGDCAYYQYPLIQAQAHLAAMKGNPHPGAYINYHLYQQNTPYVKTADPTPLIHAGGYSCPNARVINPLPYSDTIIHAAGVDDWWARYNITAGTNLTVTLNTDHGINTNLLLQTGDCSGPLAFQNIVDSGSWNFNSGTELILTLSDAGTANCSISVS